MSAATSPAARGPRPRRRLADALGVSADYLLERALGRRPRRLSDRELLEVDRLGSDDKAFVKKVLTPCCPRRSSGLLAAASELQSAAATRRPLLLEEPGLVDMDLDLIGIVAEFFREVRDVHDFGGYRFTGCRFD